MKINTKLFSYFNHFNRDSLFFIYCCLIISISLLLSFLFYTFSIHPHVSMLDPNYLWKIAGIFIFIGIMLVIKELITIQNMKS